MTALTAPSSPTPPLQPPSHTPSHNCGCCFFLFFARSCSLRFPRRRFVHSSPRSSPLPHLRLAFPNRCSALFLLSHSPFSAPLGVGSQNTHTIFTSKLRSLSLSQREFGVRTPNSNRSCVCAQTDNRRGGGKMSSIHCVAAKWQRQRRSTQRDVELR